MKNKNFIYAFALIILISTSGNCFAQQNLRFTENVMPINQVKSNTAEKKYKFQHVKHFSKEEMDAKRAEFEKRLKLTEEQKKQIRINKEKDKEKIKPIIDKIHQKRIDYAMLESNTNLDEETKLKQKDELKNEIRELKFQADNCRKENMKNFEEILTEEQKKEFEKIKTEQRKEMKKRKQAFQKSMQTQRNQK